MIEQCAYYYEDISLTGILGKKKTKAKFMIVGMMPVSYKVQRMINEGKSFWNKDLNYGKNEWLVIIIIVHQL